MHHKQCPTRNGNARRTSSERWEESGVRWKQEGVNTQTSHTCKNIMHVHALVKIHVNRRRTHARHVQYAYNPSTQSRSAARCGATVTGRMEWNGATPAPWLFPGSEPSSTYSEAVNMTPSDDNTPQDPAEPRTELSTSASIEDDRAYDGPENRKCRGLDPDPGLRHPSSMRQHHCCIDLPISRYTLISRLIRMAVRRPKHTVKPSRGRQRAPGFPDQARGGSSGPPPRGSPAESNTTESGVSARNNDEK